VTPVWLATIAASIGAGVIHLALGPEHVDELGGPGFGFYLAAILQLGWAGAAVVAFRPWRRVASSSSIGGRSPRGAPARRRLAIAGIAINATILAAWAVSRLVGLPAGETPWVPEAIGRADVISAALQGSIVFTLARSLRRAAAIAPGVARPTGLRRGAVLAAATFLVIGASTAVGLLPGGHAHAAGHSHAAGPGDHEPIGTGEQQWDDAPEGIPVDVTGTGVEASPRATSLPGGQLPASKLPAESAPPDAQPEPGDGHPHEPGAPDHSH
jgi:hypothetical protein